MEALDATLKAFFASHHIVGTIFGILTVVFGAGHAKGYYNRSAGPK